MWKSFKKLRYWQKVVLVSVLMLRLCVFAVPKYVFAQAVPPAALDTDHDGIPNSKDPDIRLTQIN